jgi:hypothetical protein
MASILDDAAGFEARDPQTMNPQKQKRYFLIVGVVIQFVVVGQMNKEGAPGFRFCERLSVHLFCQRLTCPGFPAFRRVFCYDFFCDILYDTNKTQIIIDWMSHLLFTLTWDTYFSVNHKVQLAAHVRFHMPDWKVREVLLGVVQIGTESDNAPAVVDHLVAMCGTHNAQMQYLLEGCGDGAAVNGLVMEFIRILVPHFHGMTCGAHEYVNALHMCVCVCLSMHTCMLMFACGVCVCVCVCVVCVCVLFVCVCRMWGVCVLRMCVCCTRACLCACVHVVRVYRVCI